MKVDGGVKIDVRNELEQAGKYNQNRVNDNLFDTQQQPVSGTDNNLFTSTNPADIEVPPATIGALLSTFVDDVIAIFTSDEGSTSEPDENDNPDERVTESNSTASFTA